MNGGRKLLLPTGKLWEAEAQSLQQLETSLGLRAGSRAGKGEGGDRNHEEM